MSSRVSRRAVAILLALALAGCGSVSREPSDPGGPASEGTMTTYDLRQPPSRDDLRMPVGQSVLAVRHDQPVAVRLELPEGRSLDLPVVLIAADSYAAGSSADTAAPTGMDLRTTSLPLGEAAELLRTALDGLGASTEAVGVWREQATAAEGSGRVRSGNVETDLGYLSVRLQGRYDPLGERAIVVATLFWG